MPGSGRLVTNTTTVHGFDTKFKDELPRLVSEFIGFRVMGFRSYRGLGL